MFNVESFFRQACEKGAADIHLRIGKVPSLRLLNDIVRINCPPLTESDFLDILKEISPFGKFDEIKSAYNYDFAYEMKDVARFRVNYCLDLGVPKLTMRIVPFNAPTFEDMAIPISFKNFMKNNNGIVLLTGPTGSGKSTTIACLLEYVNQNFKKHIVTIEDPVEFVYSDKKSIITQRQLEIDVATFSDGIKYSLRQDPDIILVGEIRDKLTAEAAMTAAETGHLVLSTIHTNSAVQTINRIVNMFDEDLREFMRDRLANSLKGTIAQKLIPRIGGGRVPAFEVMTVTPTVIDYMKKNELGKIYALIQEGGFDNMTTLNASIYNLLTNQIIAEKDAYTASDNPLELQQLIKGYYHGVKHSSMNNELRIE